MQAPDLIVSATKPQGEPAGVTLNRRGCAWKWSSLSWCST